MLALGDNLSADLLLLPVAFLILLSLCGLRAQRTALWWASAVALCALVSVAAKIGLR